MASRFFRRQMVAEQESPAAYLRRKRSAWCAAMGVKDREAKFPVLTAENAAEAIRYQEERIRFYEEGK